MNDAKRTLIGAMLLLAVITGLFGGFLLLNNTQSSTALRMEARASELQAIDEALRGDLQLYLTVAGSVVRRGMSKTLLSADACRKVLSDSGEPEPTLFADGAVVRVTETGVETPEGFPADVTPDAEQLQGDVGLTYSYGPDGLPLYAVFYSRVDGELCYIRWESYDELDAGARELYDYEKSFAAVENAFSTALLVIQAMPGEGSPYLFYKSEAFRAYDTAEALGITDEMLSGAFSAEDELSAEALRDARRYLDIDGQRWELLLRELGGGVMPGAVVAYLTPARDAAQPVWEQTGIVLAVFAILGVVFLVWFFSVIRLVCRHALNEKQREEYSLRRCRHRVLGILGVGAALMLAVSALTLSLFRLFDVHRQVDTALTALQQRIGENEEQSRITAKVNKEMYGEYAALTARILTEYPGVFDAE